MPRARRLPLAALTAALTTTAAAPAQAADLHAAPAGAGPAPCAAAAPCSLRGAVLAARAAPGPDVVHLAAGRYAGGLSATNEADTGLTLQGAGAGATILAGAAGVERAVAELGSGGGTMVLRDLAIEAAQAPEGVAALRARLSALDLRDVRIDQTGSPVRQAPAIDADDAGLALRLDRVSVLADTQTGDLTVSAVMAGGPLTVRDSTVTHTSTGISAALLTRGTTSIARSTLRHGDAAAGWALHVVNQSAAIAVSVDSSVLVGGNSGARLSVGTAPTTAVLRGVTIAPGAGSTGYAVDLNAFAAGSAATTRIASSLLLTRGVRGTNGATVTCTFTNLLPTGSGGCANGTGNPGRNTRLTTAELGLGADLVPGPGSPAIDSGDPAGVEAGESATDRLGRRRAGVSADRCEAGPGVRDKGAFERYRPAPAVAIDGPAALRAGAAGTWTARTNAADPAYAWSFGDGAGGGTAASAAHAFSAGPSAVALTVTDRAVGCAASASLPVLAALPPAPAPPAPAADRVAPRLSAAALGARRISRTARRLALRFRLTEAASVRVTVGRRSGRRIVAPRRLTFAGRAGANTTTLSPRRLGLRRGAYAVTLVARDAAGNASRTATLSLTVR